MSTRPIAPMTFPDVQPGGADMPRPTFLDVAPTDLVVDETYQRGLSGRSIELIRRAIGNWNWRAFEPPIVVRAEDGRLHVIDGQHTAIAAASHPGVGTIPVQIVDAPATVDRAVAFVVVNRDRLAITPLQLHHAMVAAGDETALTVDQVCERAKVRILRMPPRDGRYEIGDCMAIGSVRGLVSRRYAIGARRVLGALVEAQMAPVSAQAIKAVEALLFDPQYAGQVTGEGIGLTIRGEGQTQLEREANAFGATHGLSNWRALAGVIFRKTPKVRNGRAAA